MDLHNSTTDTIRTRVRQFYDTKTPFRVYHGTTNSTRHANFDPSTIVDVSSLNHILSIDTEKCTALVEPNVPMDRLIQETMKANLIPPVVMEFPGITVGGGFVGTAGESSSFKHGFFDRTVLSAEVVLADGKLVTASETSNQELFDALRGSFGTLGVLTLVELRLVELRPYVEVTYHPTRGFDDAMTKLQAETERDKNDYIDGILFSKDSGVIITGRLTSSSPNPSLPVQRFSRPWNQWFYLHAQSRASQSTPTPDLVPIQDYLFRYDRGAFWMGTHAFHYFGLPFSRLTRTLLDAFMHTRIMYHALHASHHSDRYIIQDIAFPAANAAPFLRFVDREFAIYPLWLCPLRGDARASMGCTREWRGDVDGLVQAEGHDQDQDHDQRQAQGESHDGNGSSSGPVYTGPYISIGVWGPYPLSTTYTSANRLLEAQTRALGGLKWLYGRVFYTEDEWSAIYDTPRYARLRQKYNAATLPTVWDKVRERSGMSDGSSEDEGLRAWARSVVRGSGLLSGLYGVWRAVWGGDYVLGRGKGKGKKGRVD
ncbi:hypothetical protein BDV95DRAFT_589812 [Massariosphaeria phaeospora]|uniref:Delta(24)-sterol reductase n=1 Tax=Massariosphaeria phaeospora TaxID=100035 RepID=A0A7C8MFU3_9PLEO|nr:hypothetical protein BDV95DRAFT_589812 [Massariosphaeria phaeospora]